MGPTEQFMRTGIKFIQTSLALSITALALAIAGCDKDDNTPAVPAAPPHSNTTPTPASKPIATTTNPSPRITTFNDTFHDVTGPVKPDKVIAKAIQTLPLFNHPPSCTVTPHG